ncbi:MAG: hypothetical protein HC933_01335 [Pleurocapsa sp. SU_196_0]|nr:hypothetical protein [Pleurocapsa sp. SU_196_0]
MIAPVLRAIEAETELRLKLVYAKSGLVDRIAQEGADSAADLLLTARKLEKHGWRSSDTAELYLDDLHVPHDALCPRGALDVAAGYRIPRCFAASIPSRNSPIPKSRTACSPTAKSTPSIAAVIMLFTALPPAPPTPNTTSPRPSGQGVNPVFGQSRSFDIRAPSAAFRRDSQCVPNVLLEDAVFQAARPGRAGNLQRLPAKMEHRIRNFP